MSAATACSDVDVASVLQLRDSVLGATELAAEQHARKPLTVQASTLALGNIGSYCYATTSFSTFHIVEVSCNVQ